MKCYIQWLFGKPYKEDKMVYFFYRSAVVFYFIATFLFLALAILANIKEWWIAFFAGAILFPLCFRIVNTINIKLSKFANRTTRR